MKHLRDQLGDALLCQPSLLPNQGVPAGIACSGGLDSMMLARLLVPILTSRGSRVFLAWLDHGWRCEDAPAERAFVHALAVELGIGFVSVRRTPPRARVRAVGREAAAREQRHSWLQQVARDQQAALIFLGHHRDDQLETILLRRAEGVPLRRAASMRWISGLFSRPMLTIPKAEIKRFALQQGWQWLEDPSNRDMSLKRNEVREHLRGHLNAADDRWIQQTLAEGEEARLYLDSLQMQVDASLPRLLIDGHEGDFALQVSSGELSGCSEDVAILALQRLCVAAHWCDRVPQRRALQPVIAALSCPGPARVFHLGAGWTARLTGSTLELRRGSRLRHEEEVSGLQASLSVEAEVNWPSFGSLQMRALGREDATRMLVEDAGAGRQFALFDPALVCEPLHVRAAGIGLRIRPFGFAGSRKVRDLLADAGVPRYQRANWPVVVDAEGQVLWLPGIRAAGYGALSQSSTTAVLLYTTASLPLRRPSITLRNRVS